MNMLAKILNTFHGFSSREQAEPPASIEPVRLLEVMQSFPIGTKIQYHPEYQEDITLNSIIIAYGINDELVYSNDVIRGWQDGKSLSLVIGNGGNEKLINKVESFCFVIPENPQEEQQLDYTRKAQIGTGGQYRRGNSISIMSSGCDRGVPVIDTSVRKTIRLKEGYYAKHNVVVLDVEMDSYDIRDKRLHYRLQINLPISLKLSEDELAYPCTLEEYAENSVRIAFSDEEPFASLINEGASIYFTIDMRNRLKKYMLIGTVQKRSPDKAVIRLNKIYRDHNYQDFNLLDALDIKASLLQHPETNQIEERAVG